MLEAHSRVGIRCPHKDCVHASPNEEFAKLHKEAKHDDCDPIDEVKDTVEEPKQATP